MEQKQKERSQTAPTDTNAKSGDAHSIVATISLDDAPNTPFVTAICDDGRGLLWIGTEEHGLWRFDPNATEKSARWKHFTTHDGLGDNAIYAITVDRLGRIWVGHLNHGVSVFNDKAWRNYDTQSGPLGERVFDMAISPDSSTSGGGDGGGDVWIATNAGLTRYSVEKDAWLYYTQTDGLPSDAIQCLAFDSRGTLYVGTQCDGIAIARPQSDYRRWIVVKGRDDLPIETSGAWGGLPSNFINDILVTRDGSVYVATNSGLARSTDRGRSFTFTRGEDWVGKARGLQQKPANIPAAPKNATLLTEDYVTSLAEDSSGKLWLGYRQKGLEIIDRRTGERQRIAPEQQIASMRTDGEKSPLRDYAFTLYAPPVPGAAIAIWCGWYGGGLSAVTNATPSAQPQTRWWRDPPPLPSPAAAPTDDDLKRLLAELQNLPTTSGGQQPLVVAMSDDWQTQGDWLGRYGKDWACCAAICSPHDYVWGAGSQPIQYNARIGLHCTSDDSIRYWVHWLYTTDRRSLEMPPTYMHSRVVKGLTTWDRYRRQAEWDDHGEAYPFNHEGPHVYCTLTVPPGQFVLSLYDFNKDGTTGNNRFRDYRVSIREHPRMLPLGNISGFPRWPELAHARIVNFRGGVWKRFLVRGPTTLTIEVNRNYSFNTILAGVMLDSLDPFPAPYISEANSLSPLPPSPPESPDIRRALFDRMEDLRQRDPRHWAQVSNRMYQAILRSAPAAAPDDSTPPALLATCEFYRCRFDAWESRLKALTTRTPREIEKSLRWDQLRYTCSGFEPKILRQWLDEHPIPTGPPTSSRKD